MPATSLAPAGLKATGRTIVTGAGFSLAVIVRSVGGDPVVCAWDSSGMEGLGALAVPAAALAFAVAMGPRRPAAASGSASRAAARRPNEAGRGRSGAG